MGFLREEFSLSSQPLLLNLTFSENKTFLKNQKIFVILHLLNLHILFAAIQRLEERS